MLQIFVDVCYNVNGLGEWDRERERERERFKEREGLCAIERGSHFNV